MLRTIGGVIVGYLAMFVFVFVTFTIAYLAMGSEGAFKPASYDVTALWIGVGFVVSSIAAIIGGFVCAAIAKNSKAPMALAGLVLVLGLLMAIPALMASDSGPPSVRAGNVSNFEAMQNAKQPGWWCLLNPLIGVAGVMLGARLKGGGSGSQ